MFKLYIFKYIKLLLHIKLKKQLSKFEQLLFRRHENIEIYIFKIINSLLLFFWCWASEQGTLSLHSFTNSVSP